MVSPSWSGGGVLLICGQMHTLLHAGPGGVVLQVEQVLRILGHRNHLDTEVGALEDRHGLKMLLSYRVLLILNQEKRDRQCCYSGKAALT
jgi:hypothetical protein